MIIDKLTITLINESIPMKRTLLIFLLITLFTSSYAQKIRFSDSTNVWNGFLWSDATDPRISIPYSDSYIGDTILHGSSYKLLNHEAAGVGTVVFIREDTLSQKVFCIMTLYPDNDTTEQLMYDYSLNTGDTFRTNHINYLVISRDSVIINSLSYHTWHMHPFRIDSIDMGIGFANDIEVIDGIGSINDPYFPLRPFSQETITNLTCFSTHDSTPPLSDTVGPYFNNTTSCSLTFGLGVNNINNKQNAVTIFPNPIDETSKIVFSNTISSGAVVVFNDIGKVILNIPFQNKAELLVGDKIKVSGIYFFKVIDKDNGNEFCGKFVAQ